MTVFISKVHREGVCDIRTGLDLNRGAKKKRKNSLTSVWNYIILTGDTASLKFHGTYLQTIVRDSFRHWKGTVRRIWDALARNYALTLNMRPIHVTVKRGDGKTTRLTRWMEWMIDKCLTRIQLTDTGICLTSTYIDTCLDSNRFTVDHAALGGISVFKSFLQDTGLSD
jgi:hypothetical protein